MNPLSAAFGAGVALRNALYDRGLFAQRRLKHPVISVGNLSVGGAGKTPFVALLAETLAQRGWALDILSRGYGRRDASIRIADPHGSARDFGDEPLLLASQLQVPVIVGADRFRAGAYAEERFADVRPAHGRWVHILDDGFQHRRLYRQMDIVLLSECDLGDRLLPAGRLREPLSSLARADVIVVDEHFRGVLPATATSKPAWRVRREVSLERPLEGPAVAFCGIARPERFFDDLTRLGTNIAAPRTFPDHHFYSQHDVENLLALRQRTNAQGFITTAKDIVNLRSAGLLNALQPCLELRLRMTFVSPAPEEVVSRIATSLARAG